MSTATTIVLADDHPIFRQGLKHVIERQPGFRVIWVCAGRRVLALLGELKPPGRSPPNSV